MSLGLVIDLLGVGVLFWAVGRCCHHYSLVLYDYDILQTNGIRKNSKAKFFYTVAIIFYVLGNLSSLIIGAVEGMCHKRLYHNHLSDLRELRSLLTPLDRDFIRLEKFYDEHEIGQNDSPAPLDIPWTWYEIY